MSRNLIIRIVLTIALLLPVIATGEWQVKPGETLILSTGDAPEPNFYGDSPTLGFCKHQKQGPGEIGIGCSIPASAFGDNGWKRGEWVFTVALPGTVERSLGATLSAEINYKGLLVTGVAADAGLTTWVGVYDVTSGNKTLVGQQEIGSVECSSSGLEGCTRSPSGSFGGILNLTLSRGHLYEIVVSAEAEANSTLGSATVKFWNDGVTNSWVEFTSISLALQEDIFEEIDKLGQKDDQILKTIDKLGERDEEILEAIDKLGQKIDSLRDQIGGNMQKIIDLLNTPQGRRDQWPMK